MSFCHFAECVKDAVTHQCARGCSLFLLTPHIQWER